MASTSEIHSKNFDGNNSFEIDILSACLSGVKTKANTNLITNTLRQFSLIYKHTYIATRKDKAYTKKCYFCKYYPSQDPKGYHFLTVRLQGYLRKHEIKWNLVKN